MSGAVGGGVEECMRQYRALREDRLRRNDIRSHFRCAKAVEIPRSQSTPLSGDDFASLLPVVPEHVMRQTYSVGSRRLKQRISNKLRGALEHLRQGLEKGRDRRTRRLSGG